MKKYRLGDDSAFRVIVNKMLEKHEVDLDFVLTYQEIDGAPWYVHYTFTQEEANEFKEWFIKFLRTECSPKLSIVQTWQEYSWFNLMYGLKINTGTGE